MTHRLHFVELSNPGHVQVYKRIFKNVMRSRKNKTVLKLQFLYIQMEMKVTLLQIYPSLVGFIGLLSFLLTRLHSIMCNYCTDRQQDIGVSRILQWRENFPKRSEPAGLGKERFPVQN